MGSSRPACPKSVRHSPPPRNQSKTPDHIARSPDSAVVGPKIPHSFVINPKPPTPGSEPKVPDSFARNQPKTVGLYKLQSGCKPAALHSKAQNWNCCQFTTKRQEPIYNQD